MRALQRECDSQKKKNVVFQVKEYEWMVDTSHSFLGFYAVKILLDNITAMLNHVADGTRR